MSKSSHISMLYLSIGIIVTVIVLLSSPPILVAEPNSEMGSAVIMAVAFYIVGFFLLKSFELDQSIRSIVDALKSENRTLRYVSRSMIGFIVGLTLLLLIVEDPIATLTYLIAGLVIAMVFVTSMLMIVKAILFFRR